MPDTRSKSRPRRRKPESRAGSTLSVRNTKVRAREIASLLTRDYPDARTALMHESAIQLLVGTILSAQCTDARVNMVTQGLFKKYVTASDFANARIAELEEEIRPTGFFRQKTKSIIQCCRDIVEKFDGCVPGTMEELTSLRGVGRKTANVVLGNFFGKPAIAVDTHVRRLSWRLGLTSSTNPDVIEQDLMELLPQDEWRPFANALILHGRAVCSERKPNCGACLMSPLCPSSMAEPLRLGPAKRP
ncbi:MAG: endonuclease III [Candidatus Eisenbacteria bacterium]